MRVSSVCTANSFSGVEWDSQRAAAERGWIYSFSLDIFILLFFARCGADNGHFVLEAFAPASKVAVRDGRHRDSSLQETLPSPFFLVPSLENSARSVFICGEGCCCFFVLFFSVWPLRLFIVQRDRAESPESHSCSSEMYYQACGTFSDSFLSSTFIV